MKTRLMRTVATVVLSLVIADVASTLDLPKMPGNFGSSSPTANSASVARDGRDALVSFTSSQLGLAQALGGYQDLAAQQQLLAGMKIGDPTVTKDQISTTVSISKSASDAINEKIAANAKLSAENKQLAAKSSLAYVNGLLASRSLVGSVQSLAKNPAALGADAGTVLTLVKELPGIVANGTSTTGVLFKYLAANGVDTSEATAAAKNLGK